MNSQEFSDLLLNNFKFKPTSDQKHAITKLSKFISDKNDISLFLLKGYAGTGKTSLMKTLVENIHFQNMNFCLLAPTGRAAKVLAKYSDRKASTIHKKIYYSKIDKSGKFQTRLKTNKIKNTLFIVDEASMISDFSNSNDLFDKKSILKDIFSFVDFKTNSKLIFLGDTAQLPPVNQTISPALNTDFIKESYNIKSEEFEINDVVRQTEESGILINATTIRNNISSNLIDFKFEKFSDIEVLSDGFDIQEAIESSYNLNGKENIIIIVRSNKRANQYNQQIRKTILFHENKVCVGDLLMITKNNYFWTSPDSEIPFLANGDIIQILEIFSIKELYGFEFAEVKIKMVDYIDQPTFDTVIILSTLDLDTPSLSYEQSNLLYNEVQNDYIKIKSKYQRFLKTKENPFFNALQVKFSYAITCHKAQGGQWPVVFIEKPYLKDGANIDYLRWLYTAVTRAESKLYLIGF
ncbi:MAG: AAA family ATPase [Flavobacteriaceae bacterium]|jgi:exodeoxyribonuclease-5